MTIEDRYYSVIQCPREIQMQCSRKMYLKAFMKTEACLKSCLFFWKSPLGIILRLLNVI